MEGPVLDARSEIIEGILNLCLTDDSLEHLSWHLKVAGVESSGLWQFSCSFLLSFCFGGDGTC